MKYLYLTVLVFVLFASCQSDDPAVIKYFETAPLNGMVYDNDHRTCAGVKVTLNDEWQATTDINGRFVFVEVQPGEHVIRLEKEGYETVSISFSFEFRTQVLYVRLLSMDYLSTMITSAVESGQWETAEELIERAEAVEEGTPTVRYLSAILALGRNRIATAVTVLTAMLESGYDDPVIYLSLADIYEYKLEDKDKAAEYLSAYLERVRDPAAGERLERIREAAGDKADDTGSNSAPEPDARLEGAESISGADEAAANSGIDSEIESGAYAAGPDPDRGSVE